MAQKNLSKDEIINKILDEESRKNTGWKQMYHIILGSVLLVTNLYFLAFVHYAYDTSPNFALAVFTVPFGVYEIYKGLIMGMKNGKI